MEPNKNNEIDATDATDETDEERKRVFSLWSSVQHSSYYDQDYSRMLPRMATYAEAEQVYLCMVFGISFSQVDKLVQAKNKNTDLKVEIRELWHRRIQQELEKRFQNTGEEKKKLEEKLRGTEEEKKKLEEKLRGTEEEKKKLEEKLQNTEKEKKKLETEGHDLKEKLTLLEKAVIIQEERQAGKPDNPLEPPDKKPDLSQEQQNRFLRQLSKKLEAMEEETIKLKNRMDRMALDGSQVRGIVLTEALTTEPSWKKKKEIKKEQDHLSALFDKGLSTEQMDYLLDCRQEGVSWNILNKISQKGIQVPLMKKLRDYYEKKENPKSDRKE